MEDSLGSRLRIGDRVELWRGSFGTVVCTFDDAEFSPAYSFHDWGYLKKGVLVEADSGNLFHYETPDEDFRVVNKRAVET